MKCSNVHCCTIFPRPVLAGWRAGHDKLPINISPVCPFQCPSKFEEVILYGLCSAQFIQNYMEFVYVLRHYISETTHKYTRHGMRRKPLTYRLNWCLFGGGNMFLAQTQTYKTKLHTFLLAATLNLSTQHESSKSIVAMSINFWLATNLTAIEICHLPGPP